MGDLPTRTRLGSCVTNKRCSKAQRHLGQLQQGGIRFRVRAGTLVIKPTSPARRFVETWAVVSATAQYGDVDQTTLMLAIGLVPGASFTPLDAKWCAIAGDHVPGALILHDQASRDRPKVTNWRDRHHGHATQSRG